MRILLIGASGMLGSDLARESALQGFEVISPSHSELDVTDPESVGKLAAGAWGPFDVCINASAYTAVDRAETEKREAYELNELGPAYVASACMNVGAQLLHVSTDFVFDGRSRSPYTEDMRTNPLGVYGASKRAGEIAVLERHPGAWILRTSWLYGPNGASFPRTMIRAWRAGKKLRVVDDQQGCPTYTAHLAVTLLDLVERRPEPGIYHASGSGAMTWREFALRSIQAYASAFGLSEPIEIEPIRTEDWPTPATRPQYSVLSNEKLRMSSIAPMPPIDVALGDFVRRLPETL